MNRWAVAYWAVGQAAGDVHGEEEAAAVRVEPGDDAWANALLGGRWIALCVARPKPRVGPRSSTGGVVRAERGRGACRPKTSDRSRAMCVW